MSFRTNTAEDWYPEPQPSDGGPEIPLNLLPPPSLSEPLWKSLLKNLRDRVAPEKLPPLQLTSRPLNVGILFGDRLSLPWYRTVFTNLGDVISPETLPPLELTSTPAEVEELLTDQLRHNWWGSLLRNLADRVAPEKLSALAVTSRPMDSILPKAWLVLPSWSEALDTPKVFYPDKPQPAARPVVTSPAVVPAPAREMRPVDPTEAALRRDLRRSRIRQRVWIAVAAAQIAYLIAMMFWPQ